MARSDSDLTHLRQTDANDDADELYSEAGLQVRHTATVERQLVLNRAVEVYLDQVATASVFTIRDGAVDGYSFFETLARRVQQEPAEAFSSTVRCHLASLGISKEQPFKPNWAMKALLAEAARLGATIARAARLVYADRRWEWAFVGGNGDAEARSGRELNCAIFADRAIGVSPATISTVARAGSLFLWTPRDGEGEQLDGGKSYRMRLLAGVPVKNYWSVVAYDAQGCKALRQARVFPTVSALSGPKANEDGSIDIFFGPRVARGREQNWIQTSEGNAWFPLLRFDGPTPAFFEQMWRPCDLETVRPPRYWTKV